MGDISIREHIRWGEGPPSEPTSTIVLTSPGRRFVDVRILLAHPDDPLQGVLPLSRLDWAVAGTSTSKFVDDPRPTNNDSNNGSAPGGNGRAQVRHSQWRHWIDSRTPDADAAAVDEGYMYPMPPSDAGAARELERGRMVNPATGLETEYEEVWREERLVLVPTTGSGGGGGLVRTWGGGGGAGGVACIVLQVGTAGKRGMVVRVGQHCQGLVRNGDEIAVERWEWDLKVGDWERKARIGTGEMPCSSAMDGDLDAEEGEELQFGGQAWTVIEKVMV